MGFIQQLGFEFDVPHKFSWMVFFSSLLFLIPSIIYTCNGDPLMGLVFFIACVFSLLGDSVATDQPVAWKYDVLSAMLVFFIMIARHFMAHPNASPLFFVKVLIPLCLFKYSSMSKTFEEWEWRHSL